MDFIRECLAQLKIRLRLDTAIVDKFEEYEQRIYSLEESLKLLKAREKIQDDNLAQLRLVVQNERRRPVASSAPAQQAD